MGSVDEGAIDPHAILGSLGLSGPFSATTLAQNRGKGVWRVQGEAGTFALRVLRADEHETARHEREAMDAARSAGAPVPEVLAEGTWDRRPVLLLSWCEGRTLRESVRARPWSAYGLGLICGRAQARLHLGQPPPSLTSGPAWLTRLGPVDPELRARLERVQTSRPRLLHLDFHPDNVLVSAGELRGLVDWTNACAGDPRADLARSWSFLVARPAGRGPKALAAAVANRLLAAGWHRGYEQVAGPLEELVLFRVWALSGLAETARAEEERFGSPFARAWLQPRLAELRRRAGLSEL